MRLLVQWMRFYQFVHLDVVQSLCRYTCLQQMAIQQRTPRITMFRRLFWFHCRKNQYYLADTVKGERLRIRKKCLRNLQMTLREGMSICENSIFMASFYMIFNAVNTNLHAIHLRWGQLTNQSFVTFSLMCIKVAWPDLDVTSIFSKPAGHRHQFEHLFKMQSSSINRFFAWWALS
jgi:hypothetical protein